MAMPADSGCATAIVHRALRAALHDGYQKERLLETLLDAPQSTGEADVLNESAGRALPLPALPSSREADVHKAPADEQASECVICLAAERECVLVECGHACVCEQCAATLATCPLCRAPIERVIRLFQ